MNKVLIFGVGVLTGMVVYIMLISIFNSKNRHWFFVKIVV
jgi:hypothetical protein